MKTRPDLLKPTAPPPAPPPSATDDAIDLAPTPTNTLSQTAAPEPVATANNEAASEEIEIEIDFNEPTQAAPAKGSTANPQSFREFAYSKELIELGNELGVEIKDFGDIAQLKSTFEAMRKQIPKDDLLKKVVSVYNESGDAQAVLKMVDFMNQKKYMDVDAQGKPIVSDRDAIIDALMIEFSVNRDDAAAYLLEKNYSETTLKIEAGRARRVMHDHQKQNLSAWEQESLARAQEAQKAQEQIRANIQKSRDEFAQYLEKNEKFNGVKFKNTAGLQKVVESMWEDGSILVDAFFTKNDDPAKREIRKDVLLDVLLRHSERIPEAIRQKYTESQKANVKNEVLRDVAKTTMNLQHNPNGSDRLSGNGPKKEGIRGSEEFLKMIEQGNFTINNRN